jgi:hypothetical protein
MQPWSRRPGLGTRGAKWHINHLATKQKLKGTRNGGPRKKPQGRYGHNMCKGPEGLHRVASREGTKKPRASWEEARKVYSAGCWCEGEELPSRNSSTRREEKEAT